jgi:hypothetical protein
MTLRACLPPASPPEAAKVRRYRAGLLLLSLPLLLSACVTVQPPQPWEKGELARAVMKMDKDPLEARFGSHVYFSKEESSGGDGVGGGGCGCN